MKTQLFKDLNYTYGKGDDDDDEWLQELMKESHAKHNDDNTKRSH